MSGRDLDGKVAVITGAGSGIGRAMADLFSRHGARVFAVDLDLEAAERTAAEIPGEAEALAVDVAQSESVAELAQRIEERAPVDVLCNNAGIFDDYAPAVETTLELWSRIMAVNVTGPFIVAKAFLPGMVERGSGAIINTASIASLVAGAGGAAYTTSKHAVLGLTRQLAWDYGPKGVRVNAVCPGATATGMSVRAQEGGNPHIRRLVDMSPAGRWAEPEEIAEAALFLASERSSYLHGSYVLADGGWTLS